MNTERVSNVTRRLTWTNSPSTQTIENVDQRLMSPTSQHGCNFNSTNNLNSIWSAPPESSIVSVEEMEKKEPVDDTETTLFAIKKKFASDVKDIERALKECNERRILLEQKVPMQKSKKAAHNSRRYGGNEEFSEKKTLPYQYRGKAHSEIHRRDKNNDFRRIQSASNILNFQKGCQPNLNSADPNVRVVSKIQFISESQRNQLKDENDYGSAAPGKQSSFLGKEDNFFPRKKKKRKGKRIEKQNKVVLQNNSLSVALKLKKQEEHRVKEKKKRAQRALDNKRRREKIEKERIDHIKQNRWELRQSRYKEQAVHQKQLKKLIQTILKLVIFGSRMSKLMKQINIRRDRIHRHSTCNLAAEMITRKFRHYCFRCYRKRVRGAIRILGAVFVLKIRLWRIKRRNKAADVLQDFLYALKGTGAFLGILTRGRRWRTYKRKVIIVQRHWRMKQVIINAQTLLIDHQWQREQEKRISEKVDKIYQSEKQTVIAANGVIDIANRGRKAMKLKLLEKKKITRKKSIRKKLFDEEENDILNLGCTTAIEIRTGIIRETLKYMKKIFMTQMNEFKNDLEHYNREQKRRQRAGAFITRTAMSQQISDGVDISTRENSLNHSIPSKRLSFLRSNEILSTTSLKVPLKPNFRTLLGKQSLNLLIRLADEHVEKVRNAWDPYNMNTDLPDYCDIGRAVALKRYQEISELYESTMTCNTKVSSKAI